MESINPNKKQLHPFFNITLFLVIMVSVSFIVQLSGIFVSILLNPSEVLTDGFEVDDALEILSNHYLILNFLTICLTLFIFYFLLKAQSQNMTQDFFQEKLSKSNFIKAFLIGFFCSFLMQVFFIILSTIPFSLIEKALASYDIHIETNVGSNFLSLNSIYLILLAPIFEEILFRGLIMRELKRKFSSKTSILIQATIFALAHIHPIHIIYTFFIGWLLGYAYEKYRNILAPILLHIGFNAFNIVIVIIMSFMKF